MRKILLISLILVLFTSFVSANVVINEFMADTPVGEADWVELYNNGTNSVNVTDWVLNDTLNTSSMAILNGVLSPQDYLIVNVSNRLNDAGDSIFLYNKSGSLIDSYVYAASVENESIGRMHDGLGSFVNFSVDDVTKGYANNRYPVFNFVPSGNISEDLNYTYNASATDLDGDSLVYTINNGPVGMTISSNGDVLWLPDNEDVGKHNITLFVNDGYNVLNYTYVLEVLNVNDAPLITNINGIVNSAVEGKFIDYQFVGNDIDPTNDSLSFSLVSGADANMSVNNSGYLSWTPLDAGNLSYIVRVSDGVGGSTDYVKSIVVTDAMEITSLNVNGANIALGDAVSVNPGQLLTLTIPVKNNLDVDMNHIFIDTEIDFLTQNLSNQSYEFSIDPLEVKNIVLSFKIPYDLKQGAYDLDISIAGEDENGFLRDVDYTYTLNLVKINHLLRIDDVRIADNNLSCFRHTDIEVDVWNIGESDEENLDISILNSQLGILETQHYNYTNETEGIVTFNFSVDVPQEVTGTYPVTVSAVSEYSTVTSVVDIDFSKCVANKIITEDFPNNTIIDLSLSPSYSVVSQSNSSLVNTNVAGNQLTIYPPVANGFGYSDVVLNATDGTYEYSNLFRVTVLAVNDAPSLGLLPSISFDEDGSYELDLNPYITDIDSSNFYWGFISSNILVSFNGNNATFRAGQNWNGSEVVNITVTDGQYLDSSVVSVTVNPIDDNSVIHSFSPVYNPILGLNEQMNFSVVASDVDNPLTYDWKLDGSSVGSLSSYLFESASAGTFNLTVYVDGVNHAWDVVVSGWPIASSFDGLTTDFSTISDLNNVSGVILEKTNYGKIEFNDSLNLTRVFDLDNTVTISDFAGVNVGTYPQLNKGAYVTLYHQNYDSMPVIYYDDGFVSSSNQINKVCNFCTLLNYTSYPTTDGEVKFYTEHFSSFRIGSVGSVEVVNYTNLDMCSAGEVGDLEVDIKEPDDGDEYGPGDDIELEIEVSNDNEDDLDAKVVAVLYDVDENEELDDVSKTMEVNGEDEETYDLVLEIPKGVDEDHDFIVFVKAYEKGDEDVHCDEDSIDIDIKREKHKIIVDDFFVSPSIAECGSMVDATVKVENIGNNDEDVVVSLENSELGVYEESSEYELKEYSDSDNDATIRLSFSVPSDVSVGTYNLKAKVDYDDGSDSMTIPLEIFGCTETKSVKAFSSSGVSSINDLGLVSNTFDVKQGQSIAIPVKIINNDEIKRAYSVALENVGDWAESLSGLKTVVVSPDMESTEYLYLKVDKDASEGMHTANIHLSSNEGESVQSISFKVEKSVDALYLTNTESIGLIVFLVILCLVFILGLIYLFSRI